MTGDEESPSERSPLLQGHEPNVKITGAPLSPVIEDVTAAESPVDIENNDLGRISSIDSGRDAQFRGSADVAGQMRYIVPAVSVGVFLAAADQTIIVSSYGRIGSELDALNLTSWVATSYFLTLTSFQPLYGKLSDIFGRKACLLSAYAIFGLGCLFCGLSRNINELIAARVFQGIGGGGMTTVVSILFSDIVPLKDRGLWQGIINIVYASGAASGAPLGGVVADFLGWRWSF
jgi:predicted MFS family arabinose efflux permease